MKRYVVLFILSIFLVFIPIAAFAKAYDSPVQFPSLPQNFVWEIMCVPFVTELEKGFSELFDDINLIEAKEDFVRSFARDENEERNQKVEERSGLKSKTDYQLYYGSKNGSENQGIAVMAVTRPFDSDFPVRLNSYQLFYSKLKDRWFFVICEFMPCRVTRP